MRVDRDVEVAMRDGVILRGDVYRPDDEAPVPAILHRTPYDRSNPLVVVSALEAERAVEAGFALFCQDVRGQYGSDGEFYTFFAEAEDGYDTIEWTAAQPWCDGAVGMSGRSYAAAAQWLAAVSHPPHLRAIVPVVTGSDYYEGWIFQGGAFQLGFNLFWVRLMTEPRAAAKIGELYRHLPLTTVPIERESGPARAYFDWLEHPTDDDYWRGLSINRRHAEIEVPALVVGGWYDTFLRGTLENFMRLQASGGSEAARAGSRLLVGPWAHGSTYGTFPDASFKEFAPGDRIDFAEVQLRFFARHLRPGGDADGDDAPVRIFVMGENTWRDEAEWPPARAVATPWYLRAGGVLAPEPPPDGEEPDGFDYDPDDPAPTVGGPTSLPAVMFKVNSGPLDQRKLEARPDVLVYTSEPLREPLEATGPLRVVLHAATDANDADWVAKLTDVDPDGVSRILAEGILRARFRAGPDRPEPVEPNRAYEYEIDLVATGNVFQEGHRVRLLVTSSSFPRFDRNSGSGKPLGTDEPGDLRPARQTVFHDAARPSHLVLPLVGYSGR